MEKWYRLFETSGNRDIALYNRESKGVGKREMPRLVIVIDEYGDLVMQSPEVEALVIKLAQKGRAAGIHLILATQRPSIDVVTGALKSNFPARVALRVASVDDSRVILGEAGAERLLGNGDLLFKGSGHPERLQAYRVQDQDLAYVQDRFPVATARFAP